MFTYLGVQAESHYVGFSGALGSVDVVLTVYLSELNPDRTRFYSALNNSVIHKIPAYDFLFSSMLQRTLNIW